ncbi:MAG TPA: hypothetical protein VFV38_51625 [Ktedonobacteraceae bacterium]|nr:hypothetical protein [Ktedonobacteraceae bacterium]
MFKFGCFTRTSRRHVVMPNCTYVLLLAFVVVLSLCVAGVPRAFASTQYHSDQPHPNIVSTQCLEEGASVEEIGDNRADGEGETVNDCLGTVGITMIIRVSSSCPGLGNGTAVLNIPGSRGPSGTLTQLFTSNIGCVVCHYVNGVLASTSFPDFTLLVTVTASGNYTFHNTAFHATSDTASDSAFINNTGQFAPTCPNFE